MAIIYYRYRKNGTRFGEELTPHKISCYIEDFESNIFGRRMFNTIYFNGTVLNEASLQAKDCLITLGVYLLLSNDEDIAAISTSEMHEKLSQLLLSDDVKEYLLKIFAYSSKHIYDVINELDDIGKAS